MKFHSIIQTALCCTAFFLASESAGADMAFKFRPKNGKIYHKGWIDLNKNGVKDIYEDPAADIDARVEDLLSKMTIEEKTCQMVTL